MALARRLHARRLGAWNSKFRRHERRYIQCSACRYQCSLASSTVLEASKLPLPTWFLAMYLMTQAKKDVSAQEPKRHVDVWYCVFRNIMTACFGRVTAEFEVVTGHFGDLTDGVFALA